MDRIDPLYFAVSNRIDVSEETRIKATSEEAGQWAEASKGNGKLLKSRQSSIGALSMGQLQHQISFLKSFISAMPWVIMATLEPRRHTMTSPSITTNCNVTTI
jgi:hypothetical protein